MPATETTIHLQDEGHKLALEQTHEVLKADAEVVKRHLTASQESQQKAAEASQIAERKYADRLTRLVRAVKPDVVLPDQFEIKGDVKTGTITVKPIEAPPAAPALKAKKGGKAR